MDGDIQGGDGDGGGRLEVGLEGDRPRTCGRCCRRRSRARGPNL